MKFYIDSSDLELVVPMLERHFVSGVTCNPLILGRAGLGVSDIESVYRALSAAGANETLFQTWGRTAQKLVENGFRIHELGPEAVVKVPATLDGFEAAWRLTGGGARVLLTAVHSVGQAALAASMGFAYITPFQGRLNEHGYDGYRVVAEIVNTLAGTGTEVLLGSVRSVRDVEIALQNGVRHFTAPPELIESMIRHPESESIAATFEEAAEMGAR